MVAAAARDCSARARADAVGSGASAGAILAAARLHARLVDMVGASDGAMTAVTMGIWMTMLVDILGASAVMVTDAPTLVVVMAGVTETTVMGDDVAISAMVMAGVMEEAVMKADMMDRARVNEAMRWSDAMVGAMAACSLRTAHALPRVPSQPRRSRAALALAVRQLGAACCHCLMMRATLTSHVVARWRARIALRLRRRSKQPSVEEKRSPTPTARIGPRSG